MLLHKLELLGGIHWEKAKEHRIYFKNLNNLIGLRLKLREDGRIHRAYLKGTQISINEAKALDCRDKEFYYDVVKGRFHYNEDLSIEAITLLMGVLI